MAPITQNKILITAGPVWVPIDRVRVITNIFAGNLGFEMARVSAERGYDVTLAMGPGRVSLEKLRDVRIINFRYYDEILEIVKSEISKRSFNTVIHSAAVSDYQLSEVFPSKIASNKPELILKLVPTVKIVDLIKKIDPGVFLVKFKLEVGKSVDELINIAIKSLHKSDADLIVANCYESVLKTHEAFIINKKHKYIKIIGKSNITNSLFDCIEKGGEIP